MSNQVEETGQAGPASRVVILGCSQPAVCRALALASRDTNALVTLIADRGALSTTQALSLVEAGVDLVFDDPWLEIVSDTIESGGVVVTESGASFEYDVLLGVPLRGGRSA